MIPRFVLALALAFTLNGCGPPAGLADVDLSVLASEQEQWDGRLVRVEGLLQTFDQPRHYWVEDAQQHRVELIPMDGLEALVGTRIRVEGRFSFAEGQGRRITIDALEPADGSRVTSP